MCSYLSTNFLAGIPQNEKHEMEQSFGRHKHNLEETEKIYRHKNEELQKLKNTQAALKIALKQNQQQANTAAAAYKKAKKEPIDALIAGSDDGKQTKSRQKANAVASTPAVRECESLSQKLSGVLEVIMTTFERRRKQLNSKRHNNGKDLSDALNKSLWHKMQHRRLNIVLRPSRKRMLSELQQYLLYEKSRTLPNGQQRPNVSTEEKIWAEQQLLLALYPEEPSEPIPSMPGNAISTLWTQPGMYLNLQNPSPVVNKSNILPVRPSFPVFEKAWCDAISASGRQSSLLLKPRHLDVLMAPLSEVAQSTAPAEAHLTGTPGVHKSKLFAVCVDCSYSIFELDAFYFVCRSIALPSILVSVLIRSKINSKKRIKFCTV